VHDSARFLAAKLSTLARWLRRDPAVKSTPGSCAPNLLRRKLTASLARDRICSVLENAAGVSMPTAHPTEYLNLGATAPIIERVSGCYSPTGASCEQLVLVIVSGGDKFGSCDGRKSDSRQHGLAAG